MPQTDTYTEGPGKQTLLLGWAAAEYPENLVAFREGCDSVVALASYIVALGSILYTGGGKEGERRKGRSSPIHGLSPRIPINWI